MARYEKKYYCPACKKKQLVKDSEWDRAAGTWHAVWICKNTPSAKHQKMKKEIDAGNVTGTNEDYYGYYDSYEAKYGDDDLDKQAAARKQEYDKCLAYYTKNPVCGVKIKTPGRNAKIIDYYNVLDLMIRDGDLIMHHLLESGDTVYRKGFETLYSSDLCDVVRHRDNHGVAVWLYWREPWEPNYAGTKLDTKSLSSAAADYIQHKGYPLRQIFKNQRFALWAKDPGSSIWFRNCPFDGTLGKKLKAEIVDWVKELEKALPDLQAQAAADDRAWVTWHRNLRREVGTITPKVSINHYDGQVKEVQIGVSGWVTPDQLRAIANILAKKESS